MDFVSSITQDTGKVSFYDNKSTVMSKPSKKNSAVNMLQSKKENIVFDENTALHGMILQKDIAEVEKQLGFVGLSKGALEQLREYIFEMVHLAREAFEARISEERKRQNNISYQKIKHDFLQEVQKVKENFLQENYDEEKNVKNSFLSKNQQNLQNIDENLQKILQQSQPQQDILTKETAQKEQNILTNNLAFIDNSYQELEKVENTLHEKNAILNSYQENIKNTLAVEREHKNNIKLQEKKVSDNHIAAGLNKFIASMLPLDNKNLESNNKEMQETLVNPVSDMAMLLVNKKI